MELSILNLSSNLIRNSNDETNFPHKLLSPIIKFPKTQLCSMIQSGSVKIGISGLDNFVKFSTWNGEFIFEKIKYVDNKNINKNHRNNLFIDAELNMIGTKIKEKLIQE